MKIGFFGTPAIAAFCLEELSKRYEISFAVTGADKPAGRHLKLHPSPVKEKAQSKNIPVHHPARLRDDEFIREIAEAKCDIFVVVAYGRIIPAEVFNIPPLKTINLHPSLLPKYRGAAPVEWAVINGERETGITVQLINERLDAGDIILQSRVPVPPAMTAGELYEIIMPAGAELLISSIEKLHSGDVSPLAQREDEATYCGKISRETARINWKAESMQIHNLVRGLNPKPGAWTTFRGTSAKILKAAPFADDPALKLDPGCLDIFGKKRLLAGTGDGCLEIVSIQPETRKAMDGLSFINGYKPAEGDHFESPGGAD